MSDDRSRVGRTIRLTSAMNDRLVALCDHLGTNPNAYLVNEIGKAISRDEVHFKVAQQSEDMFTGLADLMREADKAGK